MPVWKSWVRIQLDSASIAQWLAYYIPDPAAQSSIPSIPQNILEEKFVDTAEVNQPRYLEESGQRLENVDSTHLVPG